ncbi:hypothetical protein HOT14_gp29 [Escherichia phage vB_EcoS_IME347]|uniref:Uncharacterized protein n=1 Tax=Escherichia phage vB_EcoS_IME347 TaxID=2496546 RepID=A0A2S1GSA0_9CAUD|nr:hypothetical protein HOT14_gp29 [Escherichia phage vB_EcoS_IME347]AWD92229.1 hypothetical protein [Escherichia phage vB_EcoS_IME347]
MKRFTVKLTIKRMGRRCSTCRQNFETEVKASSAEEAVAKAKLQSGANADTHQFSINLVREI